MSSPNCSRNQPPQDGSCVLPTAMKELTPMKLLLLSLATWLAAASSAYADVTVRSSGAGAMVEVDGGLFAEYIVRSGRQPAIWPIIGPTGERYTRQYPLGPLQEHEHNDHPHHRSLWFAHGDVNGVDFWLESRKPNGPLIKHKEFVSLASDGDSATIVTRNDWVAGGKQVCGDQRTIAFSAPESGLRVIDFTIDLRATGGAVTLGDTKEGAFSVRVAGTMKIDAKQGGHAVNNHGQRDKAAWGQAAAWVNYTGPAGGKPAGIAILSAPSNFRPECRWHVRSYGLFAANPFGAKEFLPGEPKQGPVTIEAGETLTLRYVVLLHDGKLTEERIEELYQGLGGK